MQSQGRIYSKNIEIDPMKSLSHPGGQLLNIVSGEMALEKANPHEEVAKFHSSWPEGF